MSGGQIFKVSESTRTEAIKEVKDYLDNYRSNDKDISFYFRGVTSEELATALVDYHISLGTRKKEHIVSQSEEFVSNAIKVLEAKQSKISELMDYVNNNNYDVLDRLVKYVGEMAQIQDEFSPIIPSNKMTVKLVLKQGDNAYITYSEDVKSLYFRLVEVQKAFHNFERNFVTYRMQMTEAISKGNIQLAMQLKDELMQIYDAACDTLELLNPQKTKTKKSDEKSKKKPSIFVSSSQIYQIAKQFYDNLYANYTGYLNFTSDEDVENFSSEMKRFQDYATSNFQILIEWQDENGYVVKTNYDNALKQFQSLDLASQMKILEMFKKQYGEGWFTNETAMAQLYYLSTSLRNIHFAGRLIFLEAVIGKGQKNEGGNILTLGPSSYKIALDYLITGLRGYLISVYRAPGTYKDSCDEIPTALNDLLENVETTINTHTQPNLLVTPFGKQINFVNPTNSQFRLIFDAGSIFQSNQNLAMYLNSSRAGVYTNVRGFADLKAGKAGFTIPGKDMVDFTFNIGISNVYYQAPPKLIYKLLDVFKLSPYVREGVSASVASNLSINKPKGLRIDNVNVYGSTEGGSTQSWGTYRAGGRNSEISSTGPEVGDLDYLSSSRENLSLYYSRGGDVYSRFQIRGPDGPFPALTAGSVRLVKGVLKELNTNVEWQFHPDKKSKEKGESGDKEKEGKSANLAITYEANEEGGVNVHVFARVDGVWGYLTTYTLSPEQSQEILKILNKDTELSDRLSKLKEDKKKLMDKAFNLQDQIKDDPEDESLKEDYNDTMQKIRDIEKEINELQKNKGKVVGGEISGEILGTRFTPNYTMILDASKMWKGSLVIERANWQVGALYNKIRESIMAGHFNLSRGYFSGFVLKPKKERGGASGGVRGSWDSFKADVIYKDIKNLGGVLSYMKSDRIFQLALLLNHKDGQVRERAMFLLKNALFEKWVETLAFGFIYERNYEENFENWARSVSAIAKLGKESRRALGSLVKNKDFFSDIYLAYSKISATAMKVAEIERLDKNGKKVKEYVKYADKMRKELTLIHTRWSSKARVLGINMKNSELGLFVSKDLNVGGAFKKDLWQVGASEDFYGIQFPLPFLGLPNSTIRISVIPKDFGGSRTKAIGFRHESPSGTVWGFNIGDRSSYYSNAPGLQGIRMPYSWFFQTYIQRILSKSFEIDGPFYESHGKFIFGGLGVEGTRWFGKSALQGIIAYQSTSERRTTSSQEYSAWRFWLEGHYSPYLPNYQGSLNLNVQYIHNFTTFKGNIKGNFYIHTGLRLDFYPNIKRGNANISGGVNFEF